MNEFVRVRKIGEGSFGKALLVKGKSDGVHYVIKEINISKMGHKEREESRKEVKVLSKMRHPNIVSYIKSFEEIGNLYIVMDYCDGGDLFKKINNQRGIYFTEDQILDWFVQIALAIKHVHDRKILHRDIKTQNIFLTKAGIIKLGDFGIARVLRNTMELARTCIGTPYYLSPEICENRPYNNKSDVWSLGCVLYEMLTLKHAFEAGNMKNLVLKIIRGSYPPVPARYSADVRLLVASLFKRNPHDRPSINTVLRKPFLRNRADKFLPAEVAADEFSHTVLHRQPFAVPAQKPGAGKPMKPSQAPRISKPAAKYGVSVANKPARRAGNDVKKFMKPAADREAEKAKENEAREKRRQQLLKEQEDAYNKYMKSVHEQRWQKQQIEKINKAKEQNWRNSGNILSPEKEVKKSNENNANIGVREKQAGQMNKYQKAGKENRPQSAYEANRHAQPIPAWQAARQGEVNRAQGAEAADRARVLEEFWQRKREALANRNRGGAMKHPNLKQNNLVAEQNKATGGLFAEIAEGRGRNGDEQNYLARLEAIRKQNYRERVALQQRMAKVRGPVQKPPLPNEPKGDPKVDPEARRQKIAALKAQADDRAALLKEQLEARREAIFKRVQEQSKTEDNDKVVNEEKPVQKVLHMYQRPVSAKPVKVAVTPAAVGLETALKQVGATRLFRSHSEGDLSKKVEEAKENVDIELQRKQWDDKGFKPQMFQLEETASAMEATSANDVVIKPVQKMEIEKQRAKWNHGGGLDILSELGKADIQTNTVVLSKEENKEKKRTSDDESKDKKPVSWVIGDGKQGVMGVTVSVSKSTDHPSSQISDSSSSKLGVTVVKTTQTKTNSSVESKSCNSGRPLPPPPPSTSSSTTTTTTTSPSSCVSGNKTRPLPPRPGEISKSVEVKPTCDDKIPECNENKPNKAIKAWEEGSEVDKEKSVEVIRQSYQDFLSGIRSEGSVSPKDKESSVEIIVELEKREEQVGKEEEASVDRSFYKTANRLDVTTLGLHTGQYDTDVKRLRTCSLPDLRLLFQSTPINVPENGEKNKNDNDCEIEDYEDEDLDKEVDLDIPCADEESDEESQDYFSMLESMEDVLISDARSPSPLKAVRNPEYAIKSDEDCSEEEDDSESSGAMPLNEDWDSGDNDEDEDEEAAHHGKQEEKESVFARLEESRKLLEDQLGFERFMKVYKYIQSIQDNEDDLDIGVGPAPEISDLLGAEHEHLYPKILYLVMADSAYCEDNE